jgi:hypothetical protein
MRLGLGIGIGFHRPILQPAVEPPKKPEKPKKPKKPKKVEIE